MRALAAAVALTIQSAWGAFNYDQCTHNCFNRRTKTTHQQSDASLALTTKTASSKTKSCACPPTSAESERVVLCPETDDATGCSFTAYAQQADTSEVRRLPPVCGKCWTPECCPPCMSSSDCKNVAKLTQPECAKLAKKEEFTCEVSTWRQAVIKEISGELFWPSFDPSAAQTQCQPWCFSMTDAHQLAECSDCKLHPATAGCQPWCKNAPQSCNNADCAGCSVCLKPGMQKCPALKLVRCRCVLYAVSDDEGTGGTMFPLKYDDHKCPACLESAGVRNNITEASDSYCDSFEKGPFFSCPSHSHPCSGDAKGYTNFAVPTCASVNHGYVHHQPPVRVGVKSPISCQAQCNTDPLCHFFTWDKNGEKCYHERGAERSLSAMPGVFSGPKSCPMPPTKPTCKTVLIQTELTKSAAEGAKELEVESTEGFAVGDLVLIRDGENFERNEIMDTGSKAAGVGPPARRLAAPGAGSITLGKGLQHVYPEAATATVLPKEPEAATVTVLPKETEPKPEIEETSVFCVMLVGWKSFNSLRRVSCVRGDYRPVSDRELCLHEEEVEYGDELHRVMVGPLE